MDIARTQFESHLEAVLNKAFGAAYHLTRNRNDAEDLVQEAAIQAFTAFSQFRPGTNFKAWFFTIMVNCFRNRYRRKQREPAIVDMEDAPELYLFTQSTQAGLLAESGDPAAIILEKMNEEQISSAIAALPDEYREVCALYFMEQFAYQEIAEMLNVPIGTVRSRLHRGRKLLQKALWNVAVEHGVVTNLKDEKAVLEVNK